MATRAAPAEVEPRRVRAWDLPLRLFQWALVAAIALAFLSSEEGSLLAQWDVASAWTAAVPISFRIVRAAPPNRKTKPATMRSVETENAGRKGEK